MKQYLFLGLLFFISNTIAFSQSPYEVSWNKEVPYICTGVGLIGLGAYLQTLPSVLTPEDLLLLDKNNINRIDRPTTNNFSTVADHGSDFFWIGSHAAPILFLTDKKTRTHFGQIMTMYGEGASINLAMTVITKSLSRRTRPFVYNPDVPLEMKLTKNARASFFSGHASMTAFNCYFFAKVYSDFYPDNKWKPSVWTLAVTIPAVTSYLRVVAGNHYPTDVAVGYIMGAAIGILVPHVHKNKKMNEKGLSINAGYDRFYLTWNFNRKSKYR